MPRASVTQMVIELIAAGTIPPDDFPDLNAAMNAITNGNYRLNSAPPSEPMPAVVGQWASYGQRRQLIGKRVRFTRISPKYLIGVTGTVLSVGGGRRVNVKPDPGADPRIAKFLRDGGIIAVLLDSIEVIP